MNEILHWLSAHHSIQGWWIALAAWPLLEHWLARTGLVKANSSIELVGNLLVRVGLARVPGLGAAVAALATKPDAAPPALLESADDLARTRVMVSPRQVERLSREDPPK